MIKLFVVSLLITVFLVFGHTVAQADAKKPNFVVILTDDQGYGDLGCFGSEKAITPRIDRMAAEGAKLTSFYMAAPYCTPSRAALMTGNYPVRIGMAAGVCVSADSRGMNPDEITIAEVLKSVGYKTGIFGKWHLGDQPDFLPTKQGFEEFFGLPYSHDIHPFNPKGKDRFPPLPLLEGEQVVEMEPDADLLTKRFTERAVKFITDHKDEPFFLYVPHPIPHRPLHMRESYMEGVLDSYKQALAKEQEDNTVDYDVRDKLYFHALREIDWSVGEILDTLVEQGIDKDTIVIFSSDNGQARPPVGIGTAAPLRGSKGTTWEGGMRVPTVIRWPDKITAGSEFDQVMTAMDLLPTFANLAGAEAPTDRVIDGKDIASVLLEGAATPHEVIYYYRSSKLQAVRAGKWKLHLGKGGKHGGNNALYDLEADIGENKNVIAQHPEVARELRDRASKFKASLVGAIRPAGRVENPRPLTMKR